MVILKNLNPYLKAILLNPFSLVLQVNHLLFGLNQY